MTGWITAAIIAALVLGGPRFASWLDERRERRQRERERIDALRRISSDWVEDELSGEWHELRRHD